MNVDTVITDISGFDALVEKITGENIYIYGAGDYGTSIFSYMMKKEKTIQGFIVSDISKLSVVKCMGKRVYDVKSSLWSKDSLVVLGLRNKWIGEVSNYIDENTRVVVIKDEVLESIKIDESKFRIELLNSFRIKRNIRVSSAREQVLVVRVDGIGDNILSFLFLANLRKGKPQSHITILTIPAMSDLYENCPYIDRCVIYEDKSCRTSTFYERAYSAYEQSKGIFNDYRPDIVIVPRWDVDYYGASFVAYFSGAPVRVAFSEHVNRIKEQLNRGFDNMFTTVIDYRGIIHESQYPLIILKYIGVQISYNDVAMWINKNQRDGFEGDETSIFIGLSASEERRRYDYRKYELFIKWVLECGCSSNVYLIGGIESREDAYNIEKNIGDNRVVNLVEKKKLSELAAMMRESDYYIGNDTGVMHLAAACGCGVIEVSCFCEDDSIDSPNSPVRFGPISKKRAIILSAEKNNINSIDPGEIVRKFQEIRNYAII